ncbi:flagellar protein FliT [Pseudomonas sp. PDM11]|uniref:flagellar protein FliT n=1 Tax=Pseudomonas sp. PDM11 TaxID=2769309 RepID=UPI001784DF06|nr:flagellar protein FliT [Pseudomonas sp. PDM11]MBD9398217.1 flagellar protein FliT [Pseudomonas sp. PDM11]
MNSSVQRLQETGLALRDALVQQDWSAIGELDLQCRIVIDAAMVEVDRDEEQLRDSMQDLVGLYRDLVAACQTERQRLASELIQLNQSQQGAKVYQLFG